MTRCLPSVIVATLLVKKAFKKMDYYVKKHNSKVRKPEML